jgi:large repetitive protein
MRKLYSLPLSPASLRDVAKLHILGILFFFFTPDIYSQSVIPVAKDDTIVLRKTRYASSDYLNLNLGNYIIEPNSKGLWLFRAVDNQISDRLRIHYSGWVSYQGDFNRKIESFSWQVCTNTLPRVCDTAVMYVKLVNNPVIAVDDYLDIWPGQQTTFNPHDNDTEPDGEYISIGENHFITVLDSAKHGSISFQKVVDYYDKLIKFQSFKNYQGLDSFRYSICDLYGNCDTATVYINSHNEPPVADDDDAEGYFAKLKWYVTKNDSDPDDNIDFSSYKLITLPKQGKASISLDEIEDEDVSITYIPFPNSSRIIDTMSYRVCDYNNLCDTALFTIQLEANKPPYTEDIEIWDDYNAVGEQDITHNDYVYDPEGELDYSSFTFIKSPKFVDFKLDSNGKYHYWLKTPDVNDTAKYRICDKYGLCKEGYIYFKVYDNEAPSISEQSFVVSANNTIKSRIIAYDYNLNYNASGIKILKNTQHGMFSWSLDTVTNDYLDFTYKPNKDYKGLDTVSIIFCDFKGLCDTGTSTFNIIKNDAPVAFDDFIETQYDTYTQGSVATNDVDFDSNINPNSFEVLSNSKKGILYFNQNGSFSYRTYEKNAVDTIQYQVCDVMGLCDSAFLIISVKEPVYPVDTTTYHEPTALNDYANTEQGYGISIPVAMNDFDVDERFHNNLSFLSRYKYETILRPKHGATRESNNNSIYYHPNITFVGLDTFKYRVCDEKGLCDTAFVFVKVTENSNNINKAPIANDVNIDWDNRVPMQYNLLNEVIDNNIDKSSFRIIIPPKYALSYSIDSVGIYKSRYNPNLINIDSITYQVCDLGRPVLCDTGILKMKFNKFSNSISGIGYSYRTVEMNLIYPYTSLTDNFSSISTYKSPANGRIVADKYGKKYYYIPNKDFIGLDSFIYVKCNNLKCDSLKLHITVIKGTYSTPYKPFEIKDDSLIIPANRTSTIVGYPDEVVNFKLNPHSFEVVSKTKYGKLILNQYNALEYTPNENYAGRDTFYYRISDYYQYFDTVRIILDMIDTITASAFIQTSAKDICVGETIDMKVFVLFAPYCQSQGGYFWEWKSDNSGVFISSDLNPSSNHRVSFHLAGKQTYRCRIDCGSTPFYSHEVTINVHEEPIIKAQPQNTIIKYNKGTSVANSDAVFKVDAVSVAGDLTYQWQSSKNGINWVALTESSTILGAKQSILTIKKPNINIDSFYRVIISTPLGIACDIKTSASGILKFQQVEFPLSITAQPLNIEECMGGNASLQVGATGGTGIVTYAWQQSNDGVNFTTVAGATMPSYTPFSTSIGTAFYRCVVKAGTETVTSISAKVSVNPNITFTSQPANIKLLYKSGTINADSNAIFKAAVVGGSGIMSYQWQCSSNNSTWSNLTDNTTTLGVKTTALTLVKPKISEVPYFHLVASATGSGCQAATSATGILTFEARTTANVAPDAVNDNFTTIQAVAINATVATNDTDTEGALNLTSFKAIKNPKNGTLTMSNNGSFNYLPATTFVGNDTASYSVCDMPGLCDTALIFFKVTKGNHAPTVVKDVFETKLNTALKGSVALNDTDFDNNLNKNSFKITTNPKNGSVKMWANGDVLYLPKQNFIGKDTFYYQACDSLGLCSIAEVAVIIRGGFITGKIYYDANNNGIFDAGELGMSNELVLFDTDGKCLSNAAGDFQIAADTSKSYVITPTLNNPLWTVNPLSKTVKTSNNFDQLIENQYFAVRPASQVSDLAINVEAGNARPGFSSVTILTYYNKGTTVLNGKVTLTLDNNVTYESSDVALTQRSGNVLTWSVVNLQPFESRNLMIFTKTNLTAPLGKDVIYAYEGTLASITDADTTNNKGLAAITIRGSYDPNDITVDRKEYIRKANDATTPNVPLTYRIRFQNTGNAEAIRVEVLDTIQEKLDFTAFEMVAASHKFEVQVVPDTNKVKRNYTVIKWIFDNINLLDSTTKEACSHGFVTYRIKNISTKTNYLKDSILNKAAIYFDFNPPVLTDTATTKFSTLTVSTLEQYNLEFKAYPNPTNGIVNIELAHEADATIEIFNAVGQAVGRQILRGSNGQVDMSSFQTGFYIVKIKTQKGSGSVKIFKD